MPIAQGQEVISKHPGFGMLGLLQNDCDENMWPSLWLFNCDVVSIAFLFTRIQTNKNTANTPLTLMSLLPTACIFSGESLQVDRQRRFTSLIMASVPSHIWLGVQCGWAFS